MVDEVIKPHLSPSALDTFCKCPEAWRRRYLENDRSPARMVMLQGTAVHGGAKVNFKQKISSFVDLPQAEIIEAAVAEFDAVQREGCEFTHEEASRGAAIVLGEAKDQVADLARVLARRIAPVYQPTLVEQRVRLTIPNATHDLLGVLDMADDKDRVVDFKVTGKKKNQAEADSSPQLTYYAASHRVATGRECKQVRLEVLVRKKSPDTQLLISGRGIEDYKALANRMNAVMASINAGLFPPAPPGAWWCSEKWCSYWSTCPYVNSERRERQEVEGTPEFAQELTRAPDAGLLPIIEPPRPAEPEAICCSYCSRVTVRRHARLVQRIPGGGNDPQNLALVCSDCARKESSCHRPN